MSSAYSGGSALILLLLLPALCHAQVSPQIGERAQGMGGAFVAVADDATAIYWNPAGLATGGIFDAQVDLTLPPRSVDNPGAQRPMFIGAAIPALGLAYYRLRSAVSTSADRKNGQTEELGSPALETGNFAVSLVQTVVRTVVVGSTLRLVTGGGRTSADVDAGAMASVGWVRVGLVARNLREALDSQRQVRLGAALVPRSLPTRWPGPFSLAFDADATRTAAAIGAVGDVRQAALGSEQWWAKGAFGTRVGLHWSTLGAADAAVAWGATVKLPRSIFAEGHMTKGHKAGSKEWGLGLRITF
jgi:hypothetical protein